MSKVGKIFTTMALMSSAAETRDYLRGISSPPRIAIPEWKRKKCKSCRLFKNNCTTRDPNNRACNMYYKRSPS